VNEVLVLKPPLLLMKYIADIYSIISTTNTVHEVDRKRVLLLHYSVSTGQLTTGNAAWDQQLFASVQFCQSHDHDLQYAVACHRHLKVVVY
jgi:hypothetical protein